MKSLATAAAVVVLSFSASGCGKSESAPQEEAAAAPADAELATRSPVEVVQHHADVIKVPDMQALMDDYADDAVIITPPGMVPGQTPVPGPGVFSGHDAAGKVMTFLTNDQNIGPVRSMVAKVEPVGDQVAVLRWTQFPNTPQEISGEDIFIVQNGKITMQYLVP